MQLWPERCDGYNFSNFTSEASLITGIMSLKDSDDFLLVPEQIWVVTVGNLRHRYLRHCRVLICERALSFLIWKGLIDSHRLSILPYASWVDDLRYWRRKMNVLFWPVVHIFNIWLQCRLWNIPNDAIRIVKWTSEVISLLNNFLEILFNFSIHYMYNTLNCFISN